MKKTLILLLLLGFLESNGQTPWHSARTNELVTASVASALTQTSAPALKIPISIQHYSPAQLKLQQEINENAAEYVITYTPVSDSSEWTSIDSEDITPYTWQWVDLQQIQPNADTTQISLRRPIEWLREMGAQYVGSVVQLDIPEMGIHGAATVISIRPNQLDTRVWKTAEEAGYAVRPITGKFIHNSSNVYDLYFGEEVKPVGVTGNHRFWSVDRNTWIHAAELMVGEKVKSTEGYEIFKSSVKRQKAATVYNLEVYRTHNYVVSRNELLVHNNCWEALKKKVNSMIREMEDIGVTAVEPNEMMNFIATNVDKDGVFRALVPTKVLNSPMDVDQVPLLIEKSILWRWKGGKQMSKASIRIDVTGLHPSEVNTIKEGLLDRNYDASDVAEGKKKYIQVDFDLTDGRRFQFYPANDNGD